MLDQVIYTRSMPHRDLRKGGAVEKSDGFGVYSVSRQLFEPDKKVNIDLLLSQLAIKNCGKEGDAVGLTRSYDFFGVSPDSQALVYEVSRPKGEVARGNGAENRAGNYVKQGLIGSFAGYPCEYFGAEVWNAHKTPENSYYHDDDASREPAWLPQVQDAPKYGHITLERIRAFVCNGRVEAVKAAVWYLIQEMEKPMNERRVLLIRDVPENVEQWVAAIHYAFSARMAQQLTFSTNRTKLASQIENILYYHADASGNFVRGMARGPQTIRTPYCMIVGYHPQDKYSATVKQLPTSSFVVLDGTAKTIGVTPDESIRRSYYNAVIQYDEDLSDFCRVVLPGLPLKGITSRLPDLFDAYKYLLDSENRSERWTYEATMRHLKNLTAEGIPTHNALNEYLLTECRKVYSRFAQEDEKQDFALLKAMWKISLAIRREQDVIDCVADRLAAPMSRLQVNGGILVKSWHALKNSQLMPLVNKALREIMEDSELRSYAVQFNRTESAVVEAVTDMFFAAKGQDVASLNAIMGNAERYSFLYAAVLAVLEDRNALKALLGRICHCPPLLNNLALQVSGFIDTNKPDKSTLWWDMVIDASGGDIARLIQTLSTSGKMDISLVERLLSNKVSRARGCSREVLESFMDAVKKMGKTTDTGIRFFRTWISLAHVEEMADIIRAIKKCSLHVQAETALFQAIDKDLPYDKSNGIPGFVIAEMKRWGGELGIVSRSAALAEFRRTFGRERKTEKLVELAVNFADLKHVIDADFISGDYFIDIACSSAEFCDEELHLAVLCMYTIPDQKLKVRFVSEYVRKVLNHAKSRRLLIPELLSLVGATMHPYSFKGIAPAYVDEMKELLEKALEKQLPQHYKRNMAEQVNRSQESTRDVRKKLAEMLEEAAEDAAPGGIGGFFSNIFGRRDGK